MTQAIARPMYSNPPLHGALLVHSILSDPALKQQWWVLIALSCSVPPPDLDSENLGVQMPIPPLNQCIN